MFVDYFPTTEEVNLSWCITAKSDGHPFNKCQCLVIQCVFRSGSDIPPPKKKHHPSPPQKKQQVWRAQRAVDECKGKKQAANPTGLAGMVFLEQSSVYRRWNGPLEMAWFQWIWFWMFLYPIFFWMVKIRMHFWLVHLFLTEVDHKNNYPILIAWIFVWTFFFATWSSFCLFNQKTIQPKTEIKIITGLPRSLGVLARCLTDRREQAKGPPWRLFGGSSSCHTVSCSYWKS